jgi:hypothetical protein
MQLFSALPVIASRRLFIRPDSGTKSFYGQVFDYKNFEENWKKETCRMDPHELVVIAPPKIIEKEWRFICAGNEIISGSQYKIGDSSEIEPGYPPGARSKCEAIIDEGYYPDPMYTVDIGWSEGRYYLIEINCFSCSGLYACDLKAIVSKAAELAQKEWSEYA